jgi:hypothetical protein
MAISEWFPFWFSRLQLFWKVFLTLGLISPFLVMLLWIRNKTILGNRLLGMWLISATGVFFWFMMAPDPRFGFPFIIVFTLSWLVFLVPEKESNSARLTWHRFAGIFFLVIILALPLKSVFAMRNILSQVILKPMPVDTYATTKIVQDVDQYAVEKIHIDPVVFPICNTRVIAIEESGHSKEFILVFRGNSVQDGFRLMKKESPDLPENLNFSGLLIK